jgi:hypothetical protein
MGEKKIQKLVKYFGRYFTVYICNAGARPMMLIGDDYIVTNLTEAEIEGYINRAFAETCRRCRRRSNYFRVEIGDGNVDNIICGECDPTIKFAVAYFKAIDPLIAPL